jgi:hypothetical protein
MLSITLTKEPVMLGRLVGEELERIWQGSGHDLNEVLCQNVPRGSVSWTADDPAVTER